MTITPSELLAVNVPTYAEGNLHKRTGAYARCEGILSPKIKVDRQAETMPGFDALIYHEATHAAEYHAFVGVLILLMGAMTLALALVAELPAGLAFAAGWVGVYALWRRHAEARADQVAYEGAGPAEFRALVYELTAEPTTWWGRWLYTRSRKQRVERARQRARAEWK